MSCVELRHTYAAWLAAPAGTWGVVFDHSPNHEVCGAYETEDEALEQVRIVEAAQPGARGWVVQK